MAAKFFTGLPLDGPDPECVRGFGEELLKVKDGLTPRQPSGDHSHRTTRAPRAASGPVRVTISRRADLTRPPVSACAEDPLAGFDPDTRGITPQTSGADRRRQEDTHSDPA